jgi:ribosomal protein S27E
MKHHSSVTIATRKKKLRRKFFNVICPAAKNAVNHWSHKNVSCVICAVTYYLPAIAVWHPPPLAGLDIHKFTISTNKKRPCFTRANTGRSQCQECHLPILC